MGKILNILGQPSTGKASKAVDNAFAGKSGGALSKIASQPIAAGRMSGRGQMTSAKNAGGGRGQMTAAPTARERDMGNR